MISRLKENDSSLSFSIFFLKSELPNQFDEGSFLENQVRATFDDFLVLTPFGRIKKYKNFEDALIFSKNSNKISMFLRKMKTLSIFKQIFEFFANFNSFFYHIPFNKEFDAFFMDILESEKSYFNDSILRSNIPKISYPHGSSLYFQVNDFKKISKKIRKMQVFLLSHKEKEFYKSNFNLFEDNLNTIGFPRHDPDWTDKIIDFEKNKNDNWEDYILLFSRPASSYLPKERKLENLKMIKKISKKYSKRVVIKMHPKEKTEGLIDIVFDKKEENKTWKISTSHPCYLASKSFFAASFFSGLVVDLIPLAVPCIEILNLTGLKEFDNESSLRDRNQNPVFNYRYNDLVQGVQNYEELEKALNLLIADERIFKKRNQDSYVNLFPDHRNSLFKAIETIESIINV